MPEPLFHDAGVQAQRVRVSVEGWLVSLAAKSFRYEYVADRFFRQPANSDAGKKMLEVLDSTTRPYVANQCNVRGPSTSSPERLT